MLLRPRNILLVDDQAPVASVVSYAPEHGGHFVECVSDGRSAWERIACDPQLFDLVITDHHMPRMSGLALVEKLRATAFSGKIIVHSGHLATAEAAAYHALRVDQTTRLVAIVPRHPMPALRLGHRPVHHRAN